MQRILGMIVALTFVGFGCSSNAKKSKLDETPAPPSDPRVLEKVTPETQSKAATALSKVNCSVKGDERTLEVREKGKGCEVIYTKAGNEGVVASAINGKDHCQKTLEKIQNKLIGSGFTCK